MADSFLSLDGKVALITGANRGLGRAMAVVFARAGADVALLGRNQTQLAEVAAEVRALGRRAAVVLADVSIRSEVERAVAEVAELLGGLSILVNNAGISVAGRLETLGEIDWDLVLNVNLKGAYLLSQSAAPWMEKAGWGRIINIASISGQTGGVSASVAYSASKGGMVAMTKTLARDLAAAGITVNAICPGQIATDMSRGLSGERLEKLLAMIPLRRLGQPEDIAYAALFLASSEGGYITGSDYRRQRRHNDALRELGFGWQI